MSNAAATDIHHRTPAPAPVAPRRHRALRLWILGALTCLYFSLIALQINRHVSYDELLTYKIARAPSLSNVLTLMKQWDLNPPVLHILAHFSMRAFGPTLLALRLPSVLEFYVACLCLFLYTARKIGPVYASLPLLLLWYSPMFQYATEARPYALLCMWFCCLLAWWHAVLHSGERSRGALLALFISSLGLVSAHVFGILTLVPFCLAEVIRWRKTRKSDFAVWAALGLPVLGVLSYIPLYNSYKTIAHYPIAFQGSIEKIAEFYWYSLTDVLIALSACVAAAFAFRRPLSDKTPQETFSLWEWALFGGLLLNPVLLNLLMIWDKGAFWSRYAISTTLVIYLLVGVSISKIARHSRKAAYAVLLVATLSLLARRVGLPAYKAVFLPRPVNASEVFSRYPADLPIVAASGLTLLEMGFYENSSLMSRTFYLQDRTAAIHYANATMFADLEQVQQSLKFPGRIEPYNEFLRRHRSFLVLATATYPEDWVLKKLADDGAHIQLLGVYPLEYKDHEVYRVDVPGAPL